MAKREVNDTKKAKKESAAQAAEDLKVLFPDTTLVIANEHVVVHEYPFMTWLKLRPRCGDLLESFGELISNQDTLIQDDVLELFENNFHEIEFLILESIQRDQAFLSKLTDAEMQNLIFTWWDVNKHFFLRSAFRLVRTKKQTQSAGQASSTASSQMDISQT